MVCLQMTHRIRVFSWFSPKGCAVLQSSHITKHSTLGEMVYAWLESCDSLQPTEKKRLGSDTTREHSVN